MPRRLLTLSDRATVTAVARLVAAVTLGLLLLRQVSDTLAIATAGSVALGCSIILLLAALYRAAKSGHGVHRVLYAGIAIACAAGGLAQLHQVLAYVVPGRVPDFPNPGLWALVIGVNPTLAATFAVVIGRHRRQALRLPEMLDVVLVVTAAAIVALLLAQLSPWPGLGPDRDGRELMLMWRSGMIGALLLSALLATTRADVLGTRTTGLLAGGMILLEIAHAIIGRQVMSVGYIDPTASDVWWGLAVFFFALLLPEPVLRGGLEAASADEPEDEEDEQRLHGSFTDVRGRAVITAILVAAASAIALGVQEGRNPLLAAFVASFCVLLAVRTGMMLDAERDARRVLAGSVLAEREVSATLESAVATRTSELAEAQRVLQRMWTLGQQLALELDPQRVTQRFIEAVVDVAGADGGALGLAPTSGPLGMLADGGQLRIAASIGAGASLAGNLIPVAGSAMGRVIRTGKAWTHDDVSRHPDLVYPESRRVAPNVCGILVVPLHRRGERIGAVAVTSSRPRVFTAPEIARVEAMADLLTVTLSNAELVENLRKAEWRFRTLFRAAPDLVLTVLKSGRVREANDAVRDVIGREPAHVVGGMLVDVVAADDRGALQTMLDRALDGMSARCEVRIRRDDGTVRLVALAASRLPEADPPSALVIGRDMTGERDMRARLVETERLAAIGELVAGVAHEVNNPLSSISAFAQLLLRDQGLGNAQRDSIEVIKAETARASQVVRDLLAFARKSDQRREALDVNVLIERTIRLRGFQLNAANVRPELELATDLPAVLGDPRQLQQVVLNLVTNAVQAMVQVGGGTLRIATRALSGSVVIEVGDTGPGIALAARPHVFEPFFTTKREGEGTGLGLSVSYGIVTAHGGSIGIADTSERGTTMVVSLPTGGESVSVQPVGERVVQHGPRSALAGLRVLVVDDEAALRAGIQAYGEIRGFEVVHADSGEEALRVLERTGVDAVLCDLRMPGMDGPALHEVLRRDRPGLATRTVFMTGDLVASTVRSNTLGRQPLILKPFALERLEEVLVAVMRGQPVPQLALKD